ncbi:MAG: carbohydrate ABC transporter permease [Phycisphaerales bacterium]|nr:carbohydrate ABC transporter permease [Phycisphaerales bacterium]
MPDSPSQQHGRENDPPPANLEGVDAPSPEQLTYGLPYRRTKPSLTRFIPKTAIVWFLLIGGSVAMLMPFWWMLVTSVSSEEEASKSAAGFRFWTEHDAQWRNYPDALQRIGANAPVPPEGPEPEAWTAAWLKWNWQTWRPSVGFLDALANTIVITTLSVIGSILSCSLVGYAFARLRFRGREPAFLLMIATMMLPMQVTMIPMFLLFRSFGWIDTFMPLVVPLFFGTPFFIFMFRQFFAQIPEALIEAARIDGCGHLRTWFQIMLPICKPVIAITAIFTFITAWNDFMGPLIYLQSEDQQTLAVALSSFQNQYGDFRQAHFLMAASIITMIPCIVLFLVAQRQFVSGLSLGAVKG